MILKQISFDNFTLFLGLGTGILLAIFSQIFCILQSILLKKVIIKNDTDEEIEYAFRPAIGLSAIAQILVGIYIGSYILPFYILDNIKQIKMVTPENLWFYTLHGLLAMIAGIVILCSYTVILTNKRIIVVWAQFLHLKKQVEINLEDIAEITTDNSGICIISKNKTTIPIRPKKNSIMIYNKINQLIKNRKLL